MHCVVTAGPSYEPLDAVRRLTNRSTGRLGVELANWLTAAGHRVTLLLGEGATWAGERQAERVERFGIGTDLGERLRTLAGAEVGAVLHAAAVADFGFGKVWRRRADGTLSEVQAGKFSTSEGGLLAELVRTPKIICKLRVWFACARLVGWKFEVQGDRASAIRKAGEQIAECRMDACVANGPAYGDGYGLVRSSGQWEHCETRAGLFGALARLIEG